MAVVTISTGPEVALHEGDRRAWQRHEVDIARLVVRLTLLAVVLGMTALFPQALTNVSADLIRLFGRAPGPLRYALVGAFQLLIVIIPVLIVVWLLRRRTRAATLLVVGAGVAAGTIMVVLTDWLDRAAPPTEVTDLPSQAFVATDFPSVAYLAALVAGAAAASPMMTTSWRNVAWAAVVTAALVRFVSATQAPVSIAVTLALGSAVGSAALVAFGSPQRRPGSATLRAALSTGGFEIDELGDEASLSGRRTYRGTMGGRGVFLVYLDRDDRDVELFGRIVRSIRVRDVTESRLSMNPRVRAAQVNLSTTMATRAGVRVPQVLGVVPVGADSAIIVFERSSVTSLDAVLAAADEADDHVVDRDGVSETALDDMWRQIGLLHDARIAHRSLGPEHVLLDGDEVTISGLDAAVLAAGAEPRAVDRAELLVTTSRVVGVERAVAAAVRNVDRDDLVAALPFVQIPALPTPTQRAVKKPKGLVDDVRTELQTALGVDEVELVELERISVGKFVTWLGFGVLAFFLLTLVSNWSDIADTMSGLDWIWVVPMVAVTLLGTVGGAMSLSGSVVRPIAVGEATIVMFGQSFLNRFTPMNAGGMAMRIRYLQKGGTDGTVATAAIGLTSAASGAMQVVFFVFFVLWSSTDPTGGLSLDREGGTDVSVVLVFAGAAAVAIAVIALTPRFRRWVVEFLRSTFTKIRHDFGELARRPSKLCLLFGGQAIAKLSTIVAFALACWAFDVDISFAELGALYMVANTVASAVPTPGGVGAIEAALVFVLTGAGVDDATAWAAVLLFRLVNYWFPTIPGLVGLRVSERRGLV